MLIKSDISKEKKNFVYGLSVFIATTAALFLLYAYFVKGLPTWFIVITSLLYFVFTVYNAESVMGLRNALWLKLTVALITFIGEAIGVNYGWIFGSYHYTDLLGIQLLGVPLVVIVVWDIYVYSSYMLISHIVNVRFSKGLSRARTFFFSVLIALLTGVATTAADLIIDPVAVVHNLWVWHGGGVYFPEISSGVPLSNFFGWIFLSSLSIFIFKFWIEQPYVEKETVYEHAAVVPYIATFIAMIFLAMRSGLPGPAFVGGFAMGIFLLFYVESILQRRSKVQKEII